MCQNSFFFFFNFFFRTLDANALGVRLIKKSSTVLPSIMHEVTTTFLEKLQTHQGHS